MIGTTSDGSAACPNTGEGVNISNGAASNTVALCGRERLRYRARHTTTHGREAQSLLGA